MGGLGRGISMCKDPEAETSEHIGGVRQKRLEQRRTWGLVEMRAKGRQANTCRFWPWIHSKGNGRMVLAGLKLENDTVQFIFTKAGFAIMYQIAWERGWVGSRIEASDGGQRSKRSHRNHSWGS